MDELASEGQAQSDLGLLPTDLKRKFAEVGFIQGEVRVSLGWSFREEEGC